MNLTVTTKKNFIVNAQKKNERNLNITLKKTTKTQGKEREDKKTYRNHKNIEKTNKIPFNNYFKHNGLNVPFKRCRVSE